MNLQIEAMIDRYWPADTDRDTARDVIACYVEASLGIQAASSVDHALYVAIGVLTLGERDAVIDAGRDDWSPEYEGRHRAEH